MTPCWPRPRQGRGQVRRPPPPSVRSARPATCRCWPRRPPPEAKSDAGKAAKESLARLRGQDINKAIIAALEAGDAEVKVELLGVLAVRAASETAGVAAKLAGDGDEKVRRAAIEALGALGDDKQVAALVAMAKAPGPQGPLPHHRKALHGNLRAGSRQGRGRHRHRPGRARRQRARPAAQRPGPQRRGQGPGCRGGRHQRAPTPPSRTGPFACCPTGPTTPP